MPSVLLKTKVFINPNYPFSFPQKNGNLEKRHLKIPRDLSYSSTSAFTMHSMSGIKIPHGGPILKNLRKMIVKICNSVGTS